MTTSRKPLLLALAGLAVLGGGAFAWSSHCLATEQQLRGYRFATATSLLLTAAMGARLYRTGAIMPAGVLTLAGAASSAYMGRKWREWA